MNSKARLIDKLVEIVILRARELLKEGEDKKMVRQLTRRSTDKEYDDTRKPGKSTKRSGGNPQHSGYGHDPNTKIEIGGRLVPVQGGTGRELNKYKQAAKDAYQKGALLSPDEQAVARDAVHKEKVPKSDTSGKPRMTQYGQLLRTYAPKSELIFQNPDQIRLDTKNYELRLGETKRISTLLLSINLVPLLMVAESPLVLELFSASKGDRIETDKGKNVKEILKIEEVETVTGYVEDTVFHFKTLTDKNGKDVSELNFEDEATILQLVESPNSHYLTRRIGSKWERPDILVAQTQNEIWNTIPGTRKNNMEAAVQKAITEHVRTAWEENGYIQEYDIDELVKFSTTLKSTSQTSKVRFEVQAEVVLPPAQSSKRDVDAFISKFRDFDSAFGTNTGAVVIPHTIPLEEIGSVKGRFALPETLFSSQKGKWQYIITRKLSEYLDEFLDSVANLDSDAALDVKLALAKVAFGSEYNASSAEKESILQDALGIEFIDVVDPATGKKVKVPQHRLSGGSNVQGLAKRSGTQWTDRMAIHKLFDLLAMAYGRSGTIKYKGYLDFMKQITSGGVFAQCGAKVKKLPSGETVPIAPPESVRPYESSVVCTKYIKALVPTFIVKQR